MGPDPEKINNSNFEQHSEYILNQIDDDDEMEVDEQQNEGYFRLNLDNANVNEYIPVNDSTDEESDDEEENEFAIPENIHQAESSLNAPPSNIPPITTASSKIVANLWNQKTDDSSSSIELSTEKSQQITQIMSKISLPNAPNWLNELSTEGVLDRIRRRTDIDSDMN